MSKQTYFEGFPPPAPPRPKIAPKGPKIKAEAPKKKSKALFAPLVQCISINPDYFTIYNDTSQIRRNRKLNHAGPTVQRVIDTGTLSRGAISRMKRALNYLILISKDKTVVHSEKGYKFSFKHSFVTLTLSSKQKHSDSYLKNKMLKNFIDVMRKMYPGLSYVWRAEVQKNGNLHFHILTDHFIPIFYLNKVWNKIQFEHGYLNEYMEKKGTRLAPSTEIRKVKKEKELARYMRKYMIKGLEKITVAELNSKIDSTKNLLALCTEPEKIKSLQTLLSGQLKKLVELSKRKIKGKLWGCSDNLLLRPYCCEVESLSIEDRQKLFENEVLVNNEYFQVFKLPSFKNFISGLSKYARDNLRAYYSQLFQPKLIPIMEFRTNKNYTY